MKTHICESCYTEIPAGEAVLRAAGDFENVRAWHRGCYDATHRIPARRFWARESLSA